MKKKLLFILSLFFVKFCVGFNAPSSNSDCFAMDCPEANILVAPSTMCVDMFELFSAEDVGINVTYLWDFGPGAFPATSSNNTDIVQYNSGGVKTIILAVTKDGCTIYTQTQVTVVAPPDPIPSRTEQICEGDAVPLVENPAPGATYTYSPPTYVTDNGSGPIATPPQSITYSVTQTLGPCSSTYTVEIVVACSPPVPKNDSFTACQDTEIEVDVLGNDANAGGPLSNCNVNILSPPANGTINISTAPNCPITYQPNLGYGGFDSFEYEVCNDQNICASAIATVEVIAGFTDIMATISDPLCVGDNVDFSSTNPFATYFWSFGAGAVPPASNTIGNSVTYTTPGEKTIIMKTTIFGCTKTYTKTIFVEDCSLLLLDDFYETDQGVIKEVPNPLTNDLDILDNDGSGDPLVVTPASLSSSVYAGNSIVINSDGSFVYTPAAEFSGTDTFEYEACDSNGTCSNATINIIVNNCVNVQLAVWLEGAYNHDDDVMNTFLNLDPSGNSFYRGVLPGQEKLSTSTVNVAITPPNQPYNEAPWNYMGTEGQKDFAPWYYAPGSSDPMGDPDFAIYHPDVVDWVLVRFRTGEIEPSNTTVVEKTAAALLFNDGSIRFLEPCVLKQSELTSAMIWAQVDHRNHIAVMSPQAIDVSGDQLSWDFRSMDSYRITTSFGQKNIPSAPNTWVMFTGDADQMNDAPFYDITGQDQSVFSEENGDYDNYSKADFNMNADANGMDRSLLNENLGISSRVPK